VKNEEDILQHQVEAYLRVKRLKFIHIPKQLQRYLWGKGRGSIPIHIAMMASKAFKGLPDLFIFDGTQCLIMELKSAKGVLTEEQNGWIENGLVICRTFDDAKSKIDHWMEHNGVHIT